MKHIILHLSLIDYIGPAVVKSIVERHRNGDNLASLYEKSAQDVQAFYGLSAETARKIVAGLNDARRLDVELALIEKHSVTWATAWCSNYPTFLKEIHLPPTVLYWQGSLTSEEDKPLAIVGSRNVNAYGVYVIEQLVPPLVRSGWHIVSGGALGADTKAHEITLKAGGKTIAVLGSGLLKQYPARNRALFKEIISAGGAVVSSFPLLMEALPGNFPARNRIIAGLSRGTAVVQAAAKSGALITARYALDQGREVFAVPGAISDPLSAGCHALLGQGAKLITSAQDITNEFGEVIPEKYQPWDGKSHENNQPSEPLTQEKQLTGRAGVILAACINPCSVEDVATQAGLSISEAQDFLFDLQLEGKIKQNYAGLWHR